jgi:hypothetical protein
MHLAELLATAGGLDHDHPERIAAPAGPVHPRTARAAALAGAAAIAGGVAAAARWVLIHVGAAGEAAPVHQKALPTVLVVGPAWQPY